MLKTVINELRISIIAAAGLAVVLCGVYPAAVWLCAQGLFPDQANGSLISIKKQAVGSSLLAQPFTGPGYFHPRPSAAGSGYDAANSGGSNLGPTSQKLIDAVKERAAAYRKENNLAPSAVIPIDAVTASASGLDPHISVKNAFQQADRVAKARGIGEESLQKMILSRTEGRDLGIFGEPRVNVFLLNLDLDGKK
ncbi:MAG: K(+)-transporting ATPase subunit C [Deltaproteobacteria bacterium]|nr:K(+)-transporting ATPase subunit C [Deltaproteobacteria bacterium]